MTTSDSLRARIDANIRPIITEYQSRLTEYASDKVLRDAIWGFNRFRPYELALIDSPLFQRHRNVYQTSLALFTYPCAVHSRFEHSLGVAEVANRMLRSIRPTESGDSVSELETRLAALLHDICHGPFSHSSEKFYELLCAPDGSPYFSFQGSSGLLANEEPELFPESSASEILTYLTITGESFRELWKKIVDIYSRREPLLHAVDLTRMASMILGVDKFIGKERRYYRQIVNGPFDADKLDYLPRDGYFTGLAILVDIERLLHTVTVVQDPDHDYKDLGVLVSGSSVLEQIIFARTQLYTSIYHHHKVRAAHKLLEALFQKMFELKYRPAGYDLSDPVSYMMLDDYDLLHGGHPAEIDTLVRRIKNRQLPKRALVISYASLTSRQSRENVDELSAEELLDIERQVESELHLSRGDVMIDVPDLPRLYGTSQALVSIAPKKTLHLQDIYPAGAWAKAHAGYRKVAYVFTTSKDRREVGRAAKAAFAKLAYPIKLNENSLVLAKVDS